MHMAAIGGHSDRGGGVAGPRCQGHRSSQTNHGRILLRRYIIGTSARWPRVVYRLVLLFALGFQFFEKGEFYVGRSPIRSGREPPGRALGSPLATECRDERPIRKFCREMRDVGGMIGVGSPAMEKSTRGTVSTNRLRINPVETTLSPIEKTGAPR